MRDLFLPILICRLDRGSMGWLGELGKEKGPTR